MLESIRLNGWFFCVQHGRESCSDCGLKFREQNDANVHLSLRERGDSHEAIELVNKNREVFSLWEIGDLIKRSTLAPGYVFECFLHEQTGCSKCFDFTARVIEKALFDETTPSNAPTVTPPSNSSNAPTETNGLLRKIGEGRVTAQNRANWCRPKSGPIGDARPLLQNSPDPRRFVPQVVTAAPQQLFASGLDRGNIQRYRFLHKDDEDVMLVFTDGACLDQGNAQRRRGGWGFVYNDVSDGCNGPLEGTVGGPEQTSNRAELRAVIAFLQMRIWEAGGMDTFVIATDSEYVVEGICSRLEKWIAKGWRIASGAAVANQDLWEVLKREVESAEGVGLRILFWRIPREWNSKADRLAKLGADASERPLRSQRIIGMDM